MQIFVLKNSGSGFELFQTISISSNPSSIMSDEKGKTFSVLFSTAIEIYEEQNNGTYELSQSISIPADSSNLQLSKNSEILCLSFNSGSLYIYRKSITYQLEEIKSDIGSTINTISICDTLEFICIGGNGNLLVVYKYNGANFELIQSINGLFNIYDTKITEDNLVICGISSNILFYENNGSSYTLAHNVTTLESTYYRMGVSKDFSKFIIGSQTGIIYIYEYENITYELQEQINSGDSYYFI